MLLTGMSGAGKTTLLNGLARRGHAVLDTDYEGWVLGDGLWDVPRMTALLEQEGDIVVAGTVENQGDFYDRFEHVVLLSAPLHVLLARLSTRTSNPYGRNPAEQVEVAHYVRTVEPRLRRTCTLELDGRGHPTDLVDAVEALLVQVP